MVEYSEEVQSQNHSRVKESHVESNFKSELCTFVSLEQLWNVSNLKALYDEAIKEDYSNEGKRLIIDTRHNQSQIMKIILTK